MDLNEQYNKYLENKEKYLNLKNIKVGGDGDDTLPAAAPTADRPTTLSKLSHKEGDEPKYSPINIGGSNPLVINNQKASIKYNERNILWRGNLHKRHGLSPHMTAWVALSQKDALLYGYPLRLRVAKEFKILNMEIVEVRNAVRRLLEKDGIDSEDDPEVKAFDDAFPIDNGVVRRLSMFDLDSAFIGGLNREWPIEWLTAGYLGFGAGRIYLSEIDTGGHHAEMALFFKDIHTSDEYLISLEIDYDVVTPEQDEEFTRKRRSLEDKRTREEAKKRRPERQYDADDRPGVPMRLQWGDDDDEDAANNTVPNIAKSLF